MDDVTSAIESSISGLEGTPDTSDAPEIVEVEDGNDTPDETPEAVETAEPVAEAEPKAEEKPEDVPATGKKKLRAIPVENHEKSMAKLRATHATELEASKKQIAEYEQRHQTHAAHIQALEIADQNPEAFLKALADADPRYAKLLRAPAAAPEARSNQPAAGGDMPQPDQVYADGTVGYSPETLRKLLDWQAKTVTEQVTKTVTDRFEPIEREHKTAKFQAESYERAKNELAAAEAWPGFSDNEHKALIHKAMIEDRRLTLRDAYIKVVVPKLVANRDTMRAQILEEMKQKPRAAGVPVQAASTSTRSSGNTVEDAIRDSIRALKK